MPPTLPTAKMGPQENIANTFWGIPKTMFAMFFFFGIPNNVSYVFCMSKNCFVFKKSVCYVCFVEFPKSVCYVFFWKFPKSVCYINYDSKMGPQLLCAGVVV